MTVSRLNTSGRDKIGGIVSVATDIFSVNCRIRLLTAQERFVGGKDGVISTHRIYCNTIDIQNKDVAKIDNIEYDINYVNPGSLNKGTIEVDASLRK